MHLFDGILNYNATYCVNYKYLYHGYLFVRSVRLLTLTCTEQVSANKTVRFSVPNMNFCTTADAGACLVRGFQSENITLKKLTYINYITVNVIFTKIKVKMDPSSPKIQFYLMNY